MLYDILANRLAVNMLKELSEHDRKKQYSTNISFFYNSRRGSVYEAVELLHDSKLIYKEDSLLSISEKGKRFIEAFDSLINIFSEEPEKRESNVEIKYELTDIEKKVLLLLMKMQQETGTVSLAAITREMYPYESAEKKKSLVSKYLSRLVDLNLAKKSKIRREVFLEITFAGLKVAKGQIVGEMSKIL